MSTPIPTLLTPRLTLRGLRAEDLDAGRVEMDLLEGLPQCRRDHVGVRRVGTAARQRHDIELESQANGQQAEQK